MLRYLRSSHKNIKHSDKVSVVSLLLFSWADKKFDTSRFCPGDRAPQD